MLYNSEKIEIALRKYAAIMDGFNKVDVSKDEPFQKLFNGFYRIGRKKPAFYEEYYKTFEEMKKAETPSFRAIINEIFDRTGQIHPSFSSKMLATLRPDQPIYDENVRAQLCTEKPLMYGTPKERIENRIRIYSQISFCMTSMIGQQEIKDSIKEFDKEFPRYVWLTDMKKLDLILWSKGSTKNGDWTYTLSALSQDKH